MMDSDKPILGNGTILKQSILVKRNTFLIGASSGNAIYSKYYIKHDRSNIIRVRENRVKR